MMINWALYLKEMKKSWKILLLFMAILTMYISMIITMFDPEMASALKEFEKVMPNLMQAVGMSGKSDSLINFMSSYLYGMILLIFPMIYTFIKVNGLVVKYVENGSMAFLLSAPIKRKTIVISQLAVLITNITLLIVYCTILELIVAKISFPGLLDSLELLYLNLGLWLFQLFIASFAFLCSCYFNEVRYSSLIGAGLPILMYIIQMLANMKGKLTNLKYLTVFSLFQPDKFIEGDLFSIGCIIILIVFIIIFGLLSIFIFSNKDLHV